MRFGSFVFSISGDQAADGQVIRQTLREIELAEEAGMDAVWLTEHHFDGAVAYADPVVFGAAVAMRTHRVKIGFAVVELALHHPVRLAVQTALLDQLSGGRLIVGTGRGSAYNEYEYLGFGSTLEQGFDMVDEAEELLIRAWTEDNVVHHGKYWQAEFPTLRPRPLQKPHPPIIRACITEQSLLEQAAQGRPALIGIQTLDTLRRRLGRFKETMTASGFEPEQVQAALDQTWCQRALLITDSDEQALEIGQEALARFRRHLDDARRDFNPGGLPPTDPTAPPPPGDQVQHAYLAGTPETVAGKIEELRDAGVLNLLLNANVAQIPDEIVENSLRLFGEKVLPRFRDN